MSIVSEVTNFGREYVNRPRSRTAERKEKIREAYRLLFGRPMSGRCTLCYIEAVLKILKYDPMASQNYKLKKGVMALQIFGNAKKTVTPDNLTDELGDWIMENHPEKLMFFEKYPRRPIVPKGIEKVTPAKTPTIPPAEVPRNDALKSKMDALEALNKSVNNVPEYEEILPERPADETITPKTTVKKTTAKRKITKKSTKKPTSIE